MRLHGFARNVVLACLGSVLMAVLALCIAVLLTIAPLYWLFCWLSED